MIGHDSCRCLTRKEDGASARNVPSVISCQIFCWTVRIRMHAVYIELRGRNLFTLSTLTSIVSYLSLYWKHVDNWVVKYEVLRKPSILAPYFIFTETLISDDAQWPPSNVWLNFIHSEISPILSLILQWVEKCEIWPQFLTPLAFKPPSFRKGASYQKSFEVAQPIRQTADRHRCAIPLRDIPGDNGKLARYHSNTIQHVGLLCSLIFRRSSLTRSLQKLQTSKGNANCRIVTLAYKLSI